MSKKAAKKKAKPSPSKKLPPAGGVATPERPVLTFRQALYVVLSAVKSETDTLGASVDLENVRKFLANRVGADWEVVLYVSRIPLAHFYADMDGAFDASSLWQGITEGIAAPGLAAPKSFDHSASVGEVAHWLIDQVNG